MSTIETELDRLIDEWDHKTAHAAQRARLAQGVFNAHRDRALNNPRCHPLRKARLMFRGQGLSVADLAERAIVSASTIEKIERCEEGGSDLTWLRLARALSCPRQNIDPQWHG